MKWVARRLVWAAVVGCFLVIWSADEHRNIVAAQGRRPVTITRIYTGPDGQSHAEEIDVKLAPMAGIARYERSETVKLTGLNFQRWSPGYVNDWHPAHGRQYVMTLSGRGEVEIFGGQKIPLEPGRILLFEDVTGKGHISRALGTEDCVSVHASLPDL